MTDQSRAPRKQQPRDRRDKPVEREGDRDIKEGGIDGARRWVRKDGEERKEEKER